MGSNHQKQAGSKQGDECERDQGSRTAMRTLPARGCRQRKAPPTGNTGTRATADSEVLAGDQEAADTKAAEEIASAQPQVQLHAKE